MRQNYILRSIATPFDKWNTVIDVVITFNRLIAPPTDQATFFIGLRTLLKADVFGGVMSWSSSLASATITCTNLFLFPVFLSHATLLLSHFIWMFYAFSAALFSYFICVFHAVSAVIFLSFFRMVFAPTALTFAFFFRMFFIVAAFIIRVLFKPAVFAFPLFFPMFFIVATPAFSVARFATGS